eukprot:scaffold6807_cov139-Isochrysis_galbana.AAC.4
MLPPIRASDGGQCAHAPLPPVVASTPTAPPHVYQRGGRNQKGSGGLGVSHRRGDPRLALACTNGRRGRDRELWRWLVSGGGASTSAHLVGGLAFFPLPP